MNVCLSKCNADSSFTIRIKQNCLCGEMQLLEKLPDRTLSSSIYYTIYMYAQNIHKCLQRVSAASTSNILAIAMISFALHSGTLSIHHSTFTARVLCSDSRVPRPTPVGTVATKHTTLWPQNGFCTLAGPRQNALHNQQVSQAHDTALLSLFIPLKSSDCPTCKTPAVQASITTKQMVPSPSGFVPPASSILSVGPTVPGQCPVWPSQLHPSSRLALVPSPAKKVKWKDTTVITCHGSPLTPLWQTGHWLETI